MKPGLRQVDLTYDASRRRTPADIVRYEKTLEETRTDYDNIFGLEKVIRTGLEL